MDVNIITEGIERATEDEGRVHKAAGVNQLSAFLDLHLLDVHDEATVEDLLSQSTLTSKDDDLVVRDLVGQTHVAGDPLALVEAGSALNLLPDVLRDVVALYGVYDILLVDSSSERENVVVLE